MKFIKSVGLVGLLTLTLTANSAEKEMSLSECGFPLAGEQFESNLNDLLSAANATPPEVPEMTCLPSSHAYAELCLRLEIKTELPETDSSQLTYQYEKMLATYAQADLSKDGDDLFVKKVNAYVQKCAPVMLCDSASIKKEKIDLLKVALYLSNYDFLEQALEIYKWPLNNVGPVDKMTFLDFAYEEYQFYLSRYKDSPKTKELARIYTLFASKGAKHSKIKDPKKVE